MRPLRGVVEELPQVSFDADFDKSAEYLLNTKFIHLTFRTPMHCQIELET